MAEPDSIFLHAELLPNIRQLTVHVSLPNPPSEVDLRSSTITLSESRRAITVYTIRGSGDEKQDLLETLKLPARVTESSRRNLSFAGHQVDARRDANSTDYSFRLQVDDYASASMVVNNGLHEDDFVPWTAKDMPAHATLHCRFCCEAILGIRERHDTSWTWKDLPSGNWAEMMDFWHCHKPDVHMDEKDEQKAIDDQNASVKGYGASNHVVALSGTILVDVATFLVAERDCHNIKRSQVSAPTSPGSLSSTRGSIECKRCGAIVGMEDPMADGLRLYKSNLSVQRSPTLEIPKPVFESYATEMFISAQLLELINREGVRRFVIHAGHLDGILVWVFNPDLRYSSASADHSIVTKRAMKILYQEVSNVEKILEPEKGTAIPLSLEELYVPDAIFGELVLSMKRSNGVLPASARIFREWNVALLSRYEKSR